MSIFPLKPAAKKRFYAIAGGGALLALGLYLVLSALKDNMVFYYTTTEMHLKAPRETEKVRLGGMVKSQSLKKYDDQRIEFIVSDFVEEIKVFYRGSLPDLFREGQGVVAEGYYLSSGDFQANTILAKHDETYRPPTVNDNGFKGSETIIGRGAQ